MIRVALPSLVAVLTVASAPALADTDAPSPLLAQTDAIAQQVAGLRGLAIKQPIARGVKDRAAIRATVLANIAREMSDEQVAIEGRVLQRLGLLPAGADYKAM